MKKIFVLLLAIVFMISGCSSTKSIESAGVGDIIEFGKYEQDDDTENGKEPVEWIVLAKEDNKILVISKHVLDAQPYNKEYVSVTWQTCKLRRWLNTKFLEEAFSKKEQARITTTTVTAEKNPKFDTDGGKDTEDKVFLLSIQEAKKYFSSDSERISKATQYAIGYGATVPDDRTCWWWLRSPGHNHDSAAVVSTEGLLNYDGFGIYNADIGVRPALWLVIE